MTKRKCEWLERDELAMLLYKYRKSFISEVPSATGVTITEFAEDRDNLFDFIRARLEEEIRKEREACADMCLCADRRDAIRARGGEK